jgi:hypothetical protein
MQRRRQLVWSAAKTDAKGVTNDVTRDAQGATNGAKHAAVAEASRRALAPVQAQSSSIRRKHRLAARSDMRRWRDAERVGAQCACFWGFFAPRTAKIT